MDTHTEYSDTAAFLDSFEEVLHSISLPERLSGQYTLVNCIKHTSEKEIYLLADPRRKLYLLKKEVGNHCLRLRQEYEILNALVRSATPLAIPACIDYWEEQDCRFLLRTYIEGSSLVEYIDKHAVLSEQEVIHLSLDICSLIQALHSQLPPIIHRDIKPENFVLNNSVFIRAISARMSTASEKPCSIW